MPLLDRSSSAVDSVRPLSEDVTPDRNRHPLDVAVFDLVVRAVEAVGGDAVALVTQTWGEGAGMLFTQASPVHPEAAFLSVAYQDDSTLNLTVGDIWFEIFGPVEDNLDYLRSIVEAVVAGRVEQVGPVNNAAGRIYVGTRPVRVGALLFPWPWKWRKRREYSAFNSVQVPLFVRQTHVVTYQPGDRVEYIAAPVFDHIIDTGEVGIVTRVEEGWVHAEWSRSGQHSVPLAHVRLYVVQVALIITIRTWPSGVGLAW